jgi:ADP-ribose pyrophosphatase YjhB (NUDIX family)
MKNKYKNKIEVILRAVVFDKGRILLCKSKSQDHYFLPGGHLEFGEKIDEAVKREFEEELKIKVKRIYFIGVADHIYDNKYTKEGERHHEINLVYKTEIEKIKTESQEGHLEFALFTKEEFMKEKKIYPVALKKQILKWLKDKKIFWISQISK